MRGSGRSRARKSRGLRSADPDRGARAGPSSTAHAHARALGGGRRALSIGCALARRRRSLQRRPGRRSRAVAIRGQLRERYVSIERRIELRAARPKGCAPRPQQRRDPNRLRPRERIAPVFRAARCERSTADVLRCGRSLLVVAGSRRSGRRRIDPVRASHGPRRRARQETRWAWLSPGRERGAAHTQSGCGAVELANRAARVAPRSRADATRCRADRRSRRMHARLRLCVRGTRPRRSRAHAAALSARQLRCW